MSEGSSRRAPAVARAVGILDLIAESDAPRGVSEIARALDLPKSSVYGICETLVEAGVLFSAPSGYGLGSHCLRWSGAYLRHSDLTAEFRRLLAGDPRLAAHTVTLSSLEGDEVVYLACRNAQAPLGFTFRIGMRLPAVYTATGKAMLAFLPEANRSAIVARPWPEPPTARSVRDPDRFEADAATCRARGYAVDDGEIRDGMVCIGAPVLDADGRPVAGVAMSMTSVEATEAARTEFGAIVRDIAASLSH